MGRAATKKFCPLVGPGLNGGPNFCVKACYFGPKLAGFCGPKRVGPKNRLKSRFWLVQIPPKAKKKYGRAGEGRARKILPKNGPGQNDHLYLGCVLFNLKN